MRRSGRLDPALVPESERLHHEEAVGTRSAISAEFGTITEKPHLIFAEWYPSGLDPFFEVLFPDHLPDRGRDVLLDGRPVLPGIKSDRHRPGRRSQPGAVRVDLPVPALNEEVTTPTASAV